MNKKRRTRSNRGSKKNRSTSPVPHPGEQEALLPNDTSENPRQSSSLSATPLSVDSVDSGDRCTPSNESQASHDITTTESRKWKWSSKGQSLAIDTISILAITETLISMSAFLAIANYWGTTHLTISACVAPLLLLRTPASIEQGVRHAKALFLYFLKDKKNPRSPFENMSIFKKIALPLVLAIALLGMMLIQLVISLAALCIRAWSTIASTAKDPLSALRAMPQNWWNIVAHVDVRQPPELLPGFSRDISELSNEKLPIIFIWPFLGVSQISFNKNLTHLPRLPKLATAAIRVIAFTGGVILGVPALLYRLSLKGTAILWMPILWIIRSATDLPLRQQLSEFRDTWFSRIGRYYSLFTLAFFLAKLMFFATKSDLGRVCSTQLQSPICEHVIAPYTIPPWQWALAINATLGWLIFGYGDIILHRMQHNDSYSERVATAIVRTTHLTRGFLSLYTIGCTIYITATLSNAILAPLGNKVFPWQ